VNKPGGEVAISYRAKLAAENGLDLKEEPEKHPSGASQLAEKLFACWWLEHTALICFIA
jgi:hypothetical protein